MAPDWNRPRPDVRRSELWLNIVDKLCPAFFSKDQLETQLLYAYYTLEPGRRIRWEADDINGAFTWAETCQGHDFWSIVHHLELGRIDRAIQKMQEYGN